MTAGIAASVLGGAADLAAGRIVDSLVQGTILVALAGALLAMLQRLGSGTRFAIWFATLAAVATVPFLGLVWPQPATPAAWLNVHPAVMLPARWALYLFIVWSVCAGLAFAQVAAGLWRLRQLRRTCIPVDVRQLPAPVQDTLARFHARRNVRICTSGAVQAPTAIGFFRPAVVLPAWLMSELSAEDLNHVLLHELAHLRRWDDWTNLAQKVARALLFFHPAVWWIERRISLEREMACDDAVIAATANPRAYAQCLAFLAERSFLRRSLELAQAAVSRMRPTTARVAKILGAGRPAARPLWKPAIPLVMVLSLASLVFIARMPDVVVFRSPAPSPANAAQVGAGHIAPEPAASGARVVQAAVARDQSSRHLPALRAVASVRKPAVTLASSKLARGKGPAADRSATVVVLVEEAPVPGMPGVQVRVWQVLFLVRGADSNSSKRI